MPQIANETHELFAQHVAAGDSLSNAALKVGYAEKSAPNAGSRLGKLSIIRARIDELRVANFKPGTVVAPGVRSIEARVEAKFRRWDKMYKIIEERGKDPEMRKVPGGKSGLLVMSVKQVGNGPTAQIVKEYRLDTDILSEMREHEKEVREELNQIAARKDIKANFNVNAAMTSKEIGKLLKGALSDIPKEELRLLLESNPELTEIAGADPDLGDTESPEGPIEVSPVSPDDEDGATW